MKRNIFSVLLALLAFPVVAQQRMQAKTILDRTVEAFQKADGVKTRFMVKTVTNGVMEGSETGIIQLKGDKFVLHAADMVTWFDGKTQWSYVEKNDEVNISTPTHEELRQINPYTLLYMYQKGYSCKLGTTQTHRGEAVWEVILTAKDKTQELEQITLRVSKDTYQPLYILLQQRGTPTRNEITVLSYLTRQHYADSAFVFNREQYPNAEIIDLR